MAFLTGMLLIALCSLDWAKNCKAVNYKFKQYGVQKYGFGCKKGCFGHGNVSGNINDGTKVVGDHTEQANCAECKTITKDYVLQTGYYFPETTITDQQAEDYCNRKRTCFWNSKKKTCGAGSCPHMVAVRNCDTDWKDGKCEKRTDANCKFDGNSYDSGMNSVYDVQCSKLTDYYRAPNEKFSSDNAKECKYKCDHPLSTTYLRTYEYTKDIRKHCNKVYGCIYLQTDASNCSAVAVWAFIVILVVVILVVIAIIALVVFLIWKLCGNKASQVSPDNSKNTSQSAAANEDGKISDKAIHDQPVEGPYVVIKMGDKQLSTKKVAQAPVLVWGETVVFDTLGNEDEDATFELQGTDSVGTYTLRILDYVNNKQRVPLTLKNSAGAEVGVLEVDIEIKAQEEPAKVSGIFFVDKCGPGSVVPKE